MKTNWQNISINDLVEENYVHAYVLHYFGIRFFEHQTEKLSTVCREKGLKLESVIKELETPSLQQNVDLPLVTYPIDLIVAYLKHAHAHFIKNKLPYVASLVQAFEIKNTPYDSIVRDLKLVFPLFVEDFIHHIYEEEDNLFSYIRLLDKASKGKVASGKLYFKLEQNALQQFASEHEAHDDEMIGIRQITRNYYTDESTPLTIKVMYQELQEFEVNLQIHARIENEILFPKALALENQVRNKLFQGAKWN
ncbi:MAG: iron-sulfur cluster repair di-iron protein [Cyclobacteriaceae bacterium]|jgi:regulator of cell morphogenesis and NO signaling|nr:iron-sulfur cluster repair di-iron protein [Cyclobacteriaceae bacterium]